MKFFSSKMDHSKAISLLMKENIVPNRQNIQELADCSYDLDKFKLKRDKNSSRVEVLKSSIFTPKKIVVRDFVEDFRNKYSLLKNVLMQRQEVMDAVSIARGKQIQGDITVIGMVFDIVKFNKGTYRFEIENLSDSCAAIASVKNKEVLEKVKYLTEDEVVAFKGIFSKNSFFIKDIIWPDVPMMATPELDEEVYVVFSSDVHVGSDMFLEDNFKNFVSWLKGNVGNEKQKKIAKKIKYLFFIGDVVDGVGIYPGQDKELTIKDLKGQFDRFAELISEIPKNIQIIICPGNHDSTTIEEPQPALSKEFASSLYEMENVTLLPNPSLVKLHRTDKYCGLNVLLYHGYSFDYFVDKIEFLRLAGGYDKADELMKFLLKRRHLAPVCGSTLKLPMKDDPLFVGFVPHVLATGHIHKVAVGNYKGIHLISSSCWQAKTDFQEKVGHHPEPGKVPIMNLKTGKISVIDFS
jgi:DNA polymerase II small subunit